VAAALLLTLPAWLNRAAYAASDSASIATQVESDSTMRRAQRSHQRHHVARRRPHLRGIARELGAQYVIGQVPVYEYLADHNVDELGFVLRTSSLLTDNEAYFNQADPASYQLYNVRYV